MTTLPRWASSSLLLQNKAYANCGTPGVMSTLQSYTLEAWVYLENATGNQAVIGNRNIGVNAGFQLYIQNGVVVSYYPTSPYSLLSPQPITTKTWHHLATTYDRTSGTLTLYIDGVQVAQGTYAYSSAASTANWLIGATLSSGLSTWYLQGMVGEVMIWNVCRNAEEVLNDSVQISYQGDTAVLPLLMDLDFSYLPAADWSGNNIKATLQQGAQMCLTIPGLRLDGQSYANCGTDPDLSMGPTKPYTIEGWFYYSIDGGTLVSKNDQGNAGEYLVSITGKKITSMRSGLNFTLGSNPEVSPNTYYHFATTYEHLTKVLSIYVNGNLQCCQYAPDIISAPSVPFLIGATLSNTTLSDTLGGGPTKFLKGYIQNIRVWDTCLQQDQIQQWMYNQPIVELNLVASFDFTVDPPVDTTGKHSIQLLNGAVVDTMIVPIDPASPDTYVGFIQSINADYLSEHVEPPDEPPTITASVKRDPFVPLGPEYKNALWADLEKRTLADADEETRQKTRERFEQTYTQVSAMVDQNPKLLKPFSIVEENGLIRVIHHWITGDIVIFEAPAAAVTPCTLWWITFVYMVTAGFFIALGLVPSFKDVASRIWNLLRRNPTVMAALENAIAQDITVGVAIGLVGVITAEGYMWAIMKMLLTALGWWALARLLTTVVAIVTGLIAAELLVNFGIWATQLGLHAANYSADCPPAGIESSEGLPTPAMA